MSAIASRSGGRRTVRAFAQQQARYNKAGQTLIEDSIIRLVTFDPTQEVIIRWIY
jgi:hypothetical protein